LSRSKTKHVPFSRRRATPPSKGGHKRRKLSGIGVADRRLPRKLRSRPREKSPAKYRKTMKPNTRENRARWLYGRISCGRCVSVTAPVFLSRGINASLRVQKRRAISAALFGASTRLECSRFCARARAQEKERMATSNFQEQRESRDDSLNSRRAKGEDTWLSSRTFAVFSRGIFKVLNWLGVVLSQSKLLFSGHYSIFLSLSLSLNSSANGTTTADQRTCRDINVRRANGRRIFFLDCGSLPPSLPPSPAVTADRPRLAGTLIYTQWLSRSPTLFLSLSLSSFPETVGSPSESFSPGCEAVGEVFSASRALFRKHRP